MLSPSGVQTIRLDHHVAHSTAPNRQPDVAEQQPHLLQVVSDERDPRICEQGTERRQRLRIEGREVGTGPSVLQIKLAGSRVRRVGEWQIERLPRFNSQSESHDGAGGRNAIAPAQIDADAALGAGLFHDLLHPTRTADSLILDLDVCRLGLGGRSLGR